MYGCIKVQTLESRNAALLSRIGVLEKALSEAQRRYQGWKDKYMGMMCGLRT